MLNRRAFLSYSLLFLSGCAAARTTASVPNADENKPSRLRFAVTDIAGLEELEQDFGPFRQALETMLALPVEFFPVDNFLDAAPALLNNELDFAMAGPSEYLLLKARADAVPIAGVTRPEYYTMMVTRADSGLEALADLKGKKVALRTEGSTAGHIVPMKMLLDAGLQPDDYETLMLGNDGAEALTSRRVDAWAVSRLQDRRYILEPERRDEFKVLATSGNLPPDIFVANPSLGVGFLDELKSQLIANKNTLIPALYASGANSKFKKSDMVLVDDSDYQALRESYYAIGQGSIIE